jgi:broad specificity phosphatase PhoE
VWIRKLSTDAFVCVVHGASFAPEVNTTSTRTAITRIILVRHGHVEGIHPERFRGRLELALTEEGRLQAERLARRIASVCRPAAIYSSPLSRATATAAAIAVATGVRVQTDARLNDIDYGTWQGHTREDVESRWPEELRRWRRAPHLAQPPGAQTCKQH